MQRAPVADASTFVWSDFMRLAEDDGRELIDGRFLEIEMPTKLHEWIVSVLVRLLGNWAASHGGMALSSGYKVRITETRGVMPDVQFLRKGNIAEHGPQGMAGGRPDLVVEVISTTSRSHDRVVKLGWYASIGVPEYWIVDPEAKTLEQLTLENDRYVVAHALADAGQFAPSSFPGLEIDLAVMWTMPE